jgi:hypothetical protein
VCWLAPPTLGSIEKAWSIVGSPSRFIFKSPSCQKESDTRQRSPSWQQFLVTVIY